jgi:hypothetical protein
MSDVYRTVDVLVCGGGPAGISAAIQASRVGAKTLLLERFGRLGGAGVTSSVGPLMGVVNSSLVEEVLAGLSAVGQNPELLDLVYADLLDGAGADVLLHCWAFEAVVENDAVCGVRALCKEGILTIRARIVVDASADGDIAVSAGAAFEMGRAGDSLLQPMSIQYRVGGVDEERGLLCSGERAAVKVSVPEGIWRDVVEEGIENGELPENVGVIRLYESGNPGERIVNATQVNKVDGTKVADLTRAELEGRRQAILVTRFLQRHAPGYEDCHICHMPAVVGVRETRRILGVEYLTAADLLDGRKWRDAIVRNASFVIDIHNPSGAGQAHGFAEKVKPYDIPYGCLVPRTLEGLLIAGRCISGSHEAHASYRVQRIMMAVGAAAGAGAALAVQTNTRPRDVSVEAIQSELGIELDPSVL